MRKLMNILMLSCQRASELIDKKTLVSLSGREKLMLRMHTGMCDACSSYQRQSIVLDEILHKHFHSSQESKVERHTKARLKEQIISRLTGK